MYKISKPKKLVREVRQRFRFYKWLMSHIYARPREARYAETYKLFFKPKHLLGD